MAVWRAPWSIGVPPRLSISRRYVHCPAAVCASSKIQAPAALGIEPQPSISRIFHELPSGHKMEVLLSNAAPENKKQNPPIVFVHGSYHAAWCWGIHWMNYFSQAGYDCFALSLLGQGQSDPPPDRVPRTLELHALDVADFIRRDVDAPPVLMGHSFGGLIVQYYLSCTKQHSYPTLAAGILACSVPPTGNTAVVMRYLRSKPFASIKVTYSLAAKGFARSRSLCKETFFSPDMDDSEVERYQCLMKNSSVAPLFDLKKLNASLPIAKPSGSSTPPILVIGSENDFILDKQAVHETAAHYNAEEVLIPGIAHDIMLDTQWRRAADEVLRWLSCKSAKPDVELGT